MKRHAITALVCCVTLSGCDTFYGVVHIADLSRPIAPDCMRRVVETTPGVAQVRFREDRNGGYVYGYNGTPGSQVRGVAQIMQIKDGLFRYENGLRHINAIPAQSAIDATRPVIRAMEEKLSAECGFIALPVTENCTRVACPPL